MRWNNYEYARGVFGKPIKKTKAIGYCRLHRGVINTDALSRKMCVSKRCHHFIKYKEHPFWEQRENRKSNRKAVKM